MTKSIDLQFSGDVKEMLTDMCHLGDLSDPVPAILLGQVNDAEKKQYVIGYYERSDVLNAGDVKIFEADGIEFAVIQDWVCHDLHGKRLELQNDSLVLIGREGNQIT